MEHSVTRRRAIGITAAAAGLALVPLGGAARAEANLVTWRGHAMGAVASLQIHHKDRSAAERLVRRAVAEVRRLERILSLYRDNSTLVALNRSGVLPAPPPELVALLDECRRYWELTGGSFDPTVQALWTLYWEHFSRPRHDPAGPSADALRTALDKVGFRHVAFDRSRIVLGRARHGPYPQRHRPGLRDGSCCLRSCAPKASNVVSSTWARAGPSELATKACRGASASPIRTHPSG